MPRLTILDISHILDIKWFGVSEFTCWVDRHWFIHTLNQKPDLCSCTQKLVRLFYVACNICLSVWYKDLLIFLCKVDKSLLCVYAVRIALEFRRPPPQKLDLGFALPRRAYFFLALFSSLFVLIYEDLRFLYLSVRSRVHRLFHTSMLSH